MTTTFPNAYYGKAQCTKLTTTNTTAIFAIPATTVGSKKALLPTRLRMCNIGAGTPTYTVTYYDADAAESYTLFNGTFTAKETITFEFEGFPITGDDEIRLIVSIADVVHTKVTYLTELGASS